MSYPFSEPPEQIPLVILAEGCYGEPASKTATGVIRYGRWPVSTVIDSRLAGKSIPFSKHGQTAISVVSSISDALTQPLTPKALLIGIAPMGGWLPEEYRKVVIEALNAELHIISGLHVFLSDDAELAALAQANGVTIWDVRTPPEEQVITRLLPRPPQTQVVTMVGTDCSVGKMVTALELNRAFQQAGKRSAFVATGQTGIMITGEGVPLDRVIGDFMAGHLEATIDRVIQRDKPEWVFVEGQGSLIHPAYSGVTASLIHGSQPDQLILCHKAATTHIRNFASVPLPSLKAFIELYEHAVRYVKPAFVRGISINTSLLDDTAAQTLLQEVEQATGLPATDPVRFGVDNLKAALLAAQSSQ